METVQAPQLFICTVGPERIDPDELTVRRLAGEDFGAGMTSELRLASPIRTGVAPVDLPVTIFSASRANFTTVPTPDRISRVARSPCLRGVV